jgi:hypothetical protein
MRVDLKVRPTHLRDHLLDIRVTARRVPEHAQDLLEAARVGLPAHREWCLMGELGGSRAIREIRKNFRRLARRLELL